MGYGGGGSGAWLILKISAMKLNETLFIQNLDKEWESLMGKVHVVIVIEIIVIIQLHRTSCLRTSCL